MVDEWREREHGIGERERVRDWREREYGIGGIDCLWASRASRYWKGIWGLEPS